LIRRTGYRIAAAAARDLRMIEEFVVETDRASQRDRASREPTPAHSPRRYAGHTPERADLDHGLAMASCYLRA